MMRWGLTPPWAGREAAGFINARAETLQTKPAFKDRLRDSRCAVPADSFYEWRRDGERKRPMRFLVKGGESFFFAGLFQSPAGGEGETAGSFTIITTEPNALVRPFHDRMPVMLEEGDALEWVNGESMEGIAGLLRPFAAERMEYYGVSTVLNDARIDDLRCIERERETSPMLPGFGVAG